jgi:hypothetical protein
MVLYEIYSTKSKMTNTYVHVHVKLRTIQGPGWLNELGRWI